MIGKSVPRVDAYDKVTGRAKFTDDLVPANCLVAKIYHAKIGNGIVKSIDTSKAEALDGVVKVVTFKDVPNHCYPTPGHPWSVELAHQDVADRNILTGRVRYYGDDIAAVVAEDEITAQRALRLIEVEYEEYPVEIHPRKSMYGSKPPIHLDKKDNVLVRSNYFIGNVEARDIPKGVCDVVVCEAFVGNVILKLYEGVGATLISKVKAGMMSTLRSKIGALLVKPALKETLKSFDASEYGGAPLLGLKGLVVKAHGSSKANEIKNSLIQCITFSKEDICGKIQENMKQDNKGDN